jgi:hypothetical protein
VLTAADLQGGLGGRDFGLSRNVDITRVKDGGVPIAMVVNLPKGTASAPAATLSDAGMSFPWEPRALQGISAACLSYQAMLPVNFDPSVGGALPGIRGSDREQTDTFVARPSWRASGEGGADAILATGSERHTYGLEPAGYALPRGQWMRVDEEVVLNAPGRKDGTLRLWIDGALVLERFDMEYRTTPAITISGVAANVFYGSDSVVARAPRDTKIWLSPFEIRWQ